MTINIKVGNESKKEFLQIKRALNGDILIFDHEVVDIIVKPDKKKIVLFASEIMDDSVYDVQNRFFKYMVKKGVIDVFSVKGGNLYGSMEGKILNNNEIDVIDVAILAIHEWLSKEEPFYTYKNTLQDEEEEKLLNPDDKDSTELGEFPGKSKVEPLGSVSPYEKMFV